MKAHNKCELGNENNEAVRKEIELLYSGSIDSKSRDILPLLAVLNKYNSANANKLRLNIYGSCSSDIRELIDSSEEVRYFGTRPFAELLSIMHSENNVLIFIANKSGNQIPGKLFDYLGTNSPIMAIVEDKDDPVAEFVRSLNRCFVAENNTASILSVIKDLLRYPDKHSLESMNDFSPENIARKLLNVVSEEKEETRS